MRAALVPLLRRGSTALAAGAHDALSAKLAEEAGFDAIWASGFGISAVQAVPDANILTLTETLEAVRRICDAVDIPVVADCDNGFGNAINVMRTAREFEAAGAAGMCIEDNEFPKRCSFYAGVRRDLVPAEEHARKVEAACEARSRDDFAVIARTEALIAGLGLDEALGRARAYARAGADAVLVHSKQKDFAELRHFCDLWDLDVPLVAVPTTYPSVTAEELEAAGFRLAIFANQPLRAAIVAMREALVAMRQARRLSVVEERIAPLEEVYRLVGVPELKTNEKKFLHAGDGPRAVILAAGYEPRLPDGPKTMLDVKGKTILERQIEALNQAGVTDVTVVRGYRKELVRHDGARMVDNDRWADTGEAASLFCADDALRGPCLVLYGDIIFEQVVLEKLLRTKADAAVVVDRAFYDAHRAGIPVPPGVLDLVVTASPPTGARYVTPDGGSRVLRIGPEVLAADAHGEFIGMALLSATGTEALRATWTALQAARGEGLDRASVPHLFQAMVDRGHDVMAVEVHKGWMEVDSFDDYRRVWTEVER